MKESSSSVVTVANVVAGVVVGAGVTAVGRAVGDAAGTRTGEVKGEADAVRDMVVVPPKRHYLSKYVSTMLHRDGIGEGGGGAIDSKQKTCSVSTRPAERG